MTSSACDPVRPFGPGRMTSQRSTIINVAADMGGAFTVEALVGSARCEDASIGVATVYRAVSALEQSGWLERVGERSGSALYARCPAGDHHHHHLICTACGRMEPADCPLGPAAQNSETESGFVVTGHDVTLYGLCPACVAGEEG